jgi:cyclohexa-1,5-dienecarbonyl-CoA hydratase
MGKTEFEYIRLEGQDQVATLTLERSPANLLNMAMMEEVNQALLSLRGRKNLEVLVIRGAGGNFCEGLDLGEHEKKRVQRLLQVYLRIFESIRIVDVISIAAVEGRAWGAGFELALGCNMIVASETASFALPEVAHGLIPPVAAAVLPRIAPRRRAMEWILTGSQVSARRLEHDGVVNRLFPVDAFDEPLAAFVSLITGKSGPVLQLAKRAQMEAYYRNFPDALNTIQSLYLKELMALSDAREGPKAQRENRAPVWKNA